MRRKWQVFVSSTYSDLIRERQACVEAILRSSNIPAGMELFSAGSETQLEIIMRWIDDCDVYVLILGGRYGSIEPKSGLSYTEIEYNYAVEKSKPMFAIVLSDSFIDLKVDKDGKKILELDNGKLLKAFREKALSRISKIVVNESEIKLAVIESILDIQNRYEIKGWVRESEITDFNTLFNRNLELTERNNALEKMLNEKDVINKNYEDLTFKGVSFYSLKNALSNKFIKSNEGEVMNDKFGEKASFLDLLQYFSDKLINGIEVWQHTSFEDDFIVNKMYPTLKIFGLIDIEIETGISKIYSLSELGERFLAELLIENAQKEF